MRVVAGLLLTLCGACHSSSDSAVVATRVRAAVVQGLGGEVDILRSGSVDWATLADGAPLYEDDRMRTFKSSWARLVFDGGSSLRVNEESLIAIGSGVTIERGAVEGELAAGLRLRTPTMEAETLSSRDIEFR